MVVYKPNLRPVQLYQLEGENTMVSRYLPGEI